jgi:hypothetical protein
MKLTYREDPKEWRKSIWLMALGLAIVSSLLRWRRHLPVNVWLVLLLGLGLVALAALVRPRWFRGWYRLSLWLGFHSSQFLGRCALVIFFIFILTPLGLGLRLAGKDPLRLRRPRQAATYWHQARASNPLDRLF